MEEKEKIDLLEDLFEVESGSLTKETSLDDLEEWDSMAKLSLVLMENEFDQKITAEDVTQYHTVGDIIKSMK